MCPGCGQNDYEQVAWLNNCISCAAIWDPKDPSRIVEDEEFDRALDAEVPA